MGDQSHDCKGDPEECLGHRGVDAQGAARHRRPALHLHGSVGLTHDVRFAECVVQSFHVVLADGLTEAHKIVMAPKVPKEFELATFPSYIRQEQERRAGEFYKEALTS